MAFSKFGLSPTVLEGVKAMGYVDPTPIQLRGIPIIMAGQDVIGSAQTGTGKTAAFALPILSKLERHQPQPAPAGARTDPRTGGAGGDGHPRFRALHRFTRGGGVRRRGLRQADGRAQERRGRSGRHARDACSISWNAAIVNSDTVQHLVLDEADRMLDMGFLPDVRRILDRCPAAAADVAVFRHDSARRSKRSSSGR